MFAWCDNVKCLPGDAGGVEELVGRNRLEIIQVPEPMGELQCIR